MKIVSTISRYLLGLMFTVLMMPAFPAANQAAFRPVQRQEKDEDTILHIPFIFTGIPDGSILRIDRAVVRPVAPSTRRARIIGAVGDPGDFEVLNNGQNNSKRPVEEILHMRAIPTRG